jgi:hypothetical protein
VSLSGSFDNCDDAVVVPGVNSVSLPRYAIKRLTPPGCFTKKTGPIALAAGQLPGILILSECNTSLAPFPDS